MKHSEIASYRSCYSDSKFWNTLSRFASRLSQKIIYQALVLYYVMKSSQTPWQAKATIVAALGYLISPVDFCPDMIPVAGLADDASVIGAAYAAVRSSVTSDIEQQAQTKLSSLFNSYSSCR